MCGSITMVGLIRNGPRGGVDAPTGDRHAIPGPDLLSVILRLVAQEGEVSGGGAGMRNY